jgi:hypothetical protein
VEAAFARTQASVLDLREQWKRWRTLVVPSPPLAEAEMVFLTSGALGLAPVRQLSDETERLLAEFATEEPPWFRRLGERFQSLVSG